MRHEFESCTPPAFCPKHGLFPATGLALQNVTGITFAHCQTNCPVPGCDQACEVIPGRYSADDKGRLDLLLDPSISAEALAAIKAIAVQLRDGAISADVAQKEIERLAPQAAALFKGWTRGEKIAMAGAIIAAIALIKPSSPTVVNVQPVIERVFERSPNEWLSSSSLSKVPLPRPRPKGH
jgi:hypothetical protein